MLSGSRAVAGFDSASAMMRVLGEWQAVLGHARRRGQLVAVEPSRYPRHFRAVTGFHRDLSRLPRVPAAPPLSWDAARHHLATHAAAGNLALG